MIDGRLGECGDAECLDIGFSIRQRCFLQNQNTNLWNCYKKDQSWLLDKPPIQSKENLNKKFHECQGSFK